MMRSGQKKRSVPAIRQFRAYGTNASTNLNRLERNAEINLGKIAGEGIIHTFWGLVN